MGKLINFFKFAFYSVKIRIVSLNGGVRHVDLMDLSRTIRFCPFDVGNKLPHVEWED